MPRFGRDAFHEHGQDPWSAFRQLYEQGIPTATRPERVTRSAAEVKVHQPSLTTHPEAQCP